MSNIVQETPEQITTIIKNTMGLDVDPADISELGGGTFNQVYLVEPPSHDKLVVRIAPAEDANTHWDDVALMRREYAIQPYFASLSGLMPSILAVDFTHQFLARDYMVQTHVKGERWEDIEDELEDDVNLNLWTQFGEITRKIHDTVGEHFGWPYPSTPSTTWHEVVIERFEKIIVDMEKRSLDTYSISNVLAYLHSEDQLLSAITEPRLLHGDLWLFNLLIDRDAPKITGLLDADRAWWGDPLADMTIFLLAIRDGEEGWSSRREAFEAGYGPIGKSSNEAQRLEVYKIMHLGTIAEWASRNDLHDVVDQACKKQAELAELLLE